MKCVITGGEGFVGTYLQKELEREWTDAQIFVWDLPDVDITKPDTYRARLREIQPDWIVHLAAVASVPAAIKNPGLTEQVNVGGTRQLLEVVQAESSSTKVLFVSTADIYGLAGKDVTNGVLPELSLSDAQPQNVYAESKLVAEQVIEEQYNQRVIRARPFPHIGPGQGLGFVTADFASQIAAIEVGDQSPVIKVGNLEARRDFTDVRDVVRAYRLLMEHGELGEVYNIASGTAVAIEEILNTLLSLSDAVITVEQDEARMRPSDVPVLVGDATALRDATGWEPTISIDQSLREILDWWRQRP